MIRLPIRLQVPRVFLASLIPASFLVLGSYACSSATPSGSTTGSGTGASEDAGVNQCAPPDSAVDPAQPTGPTATCASPGKPTPGPADEHCQGDGGLMTQTVSQSACCFPGDAGGPGTCPYNPTMYGMEGDDDDCKYHVTWTSSAICEGDAGVQFKVVATSLTTHGPVTGAHIHAEVFTTTPGDAACDDMSTHESPFPFTDYMSENPPGTYTGRTIFDAPGQWTVRFHLNENCLDVLPDSPHGHAAFHITVP